MIDCRIKDGVDGSSRSVRVDGSGAIVTIENAFPPTVGSGGMRVFRQYLTDDGTASGSNDMKVDGSSTNVPFYVQSQEEEDLYISVLSFIIADALASLNQFGNLTALTNGLTLTYEDQKGTVTIHDSITTNFELVSLCLAEPAFGDANNAFKAGNVVGASEAFIPVLDLRRVFGFRWGVKLDGGTNQRLALTVRDDVTGVDQLDCIAYGFTIPKE